ncbi:MAG: methylcrotonoyl-CoA carboxylase [Rhizobiaceae bacterium]|nr:methylcrotonoyl-CoA carboxylase [Rhizobiaceae bacterium]
MLESLLIANRGEIARRIIRTARAMGIRTIAVYSEADADLPFVAEADESVFLGPSPASESYLRQDKVIASALKTRATAIHPGYGFLSENAAFAEAVQAAGIVWVGAPPQSIRAMGLKDAAKQLMLEAGVPVTPGYMGEDQSPERLNSEADRIGYPVLIKAVAGGGGKGMRRVDGASRFLEALQSCRREAKASFGDDRVLIEKYILNPRHIEVQVFADTHGNCVHLFERDCSVQRRHQKVIEEAPAPGMDEATRQAICAAAVRAAKAVSYEGAGTVEFIADSSEGLRADRIWFMEMNTRLQVEHPVTEAITGQDLVRWQLEVAAGKSLPKTQDQLTINGWAVEGRMYAENPAVGYLPSTGRLAHLRLPSGVRVDSGVTEGDEITSYYDPMIAKVICHADDRKSALARLAAACAQVEIWPVKSNANLLSRIAANPEFTSGAVDTGFLERNDAELVAREPDDLSADLAVSALVTENDAGPWGSLPGFRVAAGPDLRARVDIGSKTIWANGERQGAARSIVIAGSRVLFDRGNAWEIRQPTTQTAQSSSSTGDGSILSPLPGLITSVDIQPGQKVAKGDRLVIVEAMKMEHTLRAPFDGLIEAIKVAVGSKVSEGHLVVIVKAGEH